MSSKNHKDILDELTDAQKKRFYESIQQANEGKTFANDEVKQKAKEWLKKPYKQILEELEDIRLYDAVKARNEKSIPFTQYLQRRRKKLY